MGKTYFGFALADSMFDAAGNCQINRQVLTEDEAKRQIAAGIISCLNPSHTATIEAMGSRYGISVEIPEKAPIVSIGQGDSVIVMGVRGLPRLEGDSHHYTSEQVAKATFKFTQYSV